MDTTPKIKKAMTKDEVACLVDIIQENPILTSKETNACTNKLKENAWMSVTAAFNAKCGSVPRNKEQLKLKWDNLKKSARKRVHQIRTNNLKTGGGKPDLIPPDEILEKVAALLGTTCYGFQVPFGGDGVGSGGVVLELEVDKCTNSIEFLQQPGTSNALPSDVLLPSTNAAQKRKVSECEIIEDSNVDPKFLFGMPTMAKPLQSKNKKKKSNFDEEQRQMYQAIAKYYEKKTEKIDIEIKLLKILRNNNKENNSS